MQRILSNYYSFIFNYELRLFTDVFKVIEDYLNGTLIYNTKCLSDDISNTFCKKMYDTIVAYCPPLNATEIDVDKSIDSLLELSIIFLLCSHEKETIEKRSFKHFIFFDNIENFIKGYMVYNKDINSIARIMHQFVNTLTERFNHIGTDGLNFTQHFKIILAIRDTTEKIIDEVYLQDEGHSKIQLDVSTWFSLSEILEKN